MFSSRNKALIYKLNRQKLTKTIKLSFFLFFSSVETIQGLYWYYCMVAVLCSYIIIFFNSRWEFYNVFVKSEQRHSLKAESKYLQILIQYNTCSLPPQLLIFLPCIHSSQVPVIVKRTIRKDPISTCTWVIRIYCAGL